MSLEIRCLIVEGIAADAKSRALAIEFDMVGLHAWPPIRITDGIMDNSAELLTVADICRTLGVSRAWVIEHSNGRRRPVLPSIKLGKVRRFDPLDLKSFIDDCRRIGQTRVQNGGAKLQR